MKLKFSFTVPLFISKISRNTIHDVCNSDAFKEETRRLYAKYVPDSVNMTAAECARQVNDYHEGIHSPHELGVTIQGSQIFVKKGRDLQGLADALFKQCKDVIKASRIEGVSVFLEIYASEPNGDNRVFSAGPWVS